MHVKRKDETLLFLCLTLHIYTPQDSTPPPQHNNHALFPDDDEEEEDEEQEATGESVRRRLLAQLRVTSRPASVHRVLGPEDQLLLVLTRLRLGLLLHDLAFRFHVAEATASRVWGHWLGLMQRRLQQVGTGGTGGTGW